MQKLTSICFVLFLLLSAIDAAVPQSKTTILFHDNFINSDNNWNRNREALKYGTGSLSKRHSRDINVRGLYITQTTPPHNSVSWVSRDINIDKTIDLIDTTFELETTSVGQGNTLWHRVALTIQFFNRFDQYIGHTDLIRIAGTHSKDTYRSVIIPEESATKMRILFSIIGVDGSARLSSINVQGVNYHKDAVDKSIRIMPTPHPYKIKCIDNNVEFDKIYVTGKGLKKEHYHLIRNILYKKLNKKHLVFEDDDSPGNLAKLHIVIVSNLTNIPNDAAKAVSNNEGYFIESTNNKISVFASSIKGIMYALYTLQQMIQKEIDGYNIQSCKISDWPSLAVRGIAGGQNSEKYLNKLAEYKINSVQISGAPGLWQDWNDRISLNLIKEVKKTSKSLMKNHINGTVAIWPGGYGDIFIWSEPTHTDVIFKKIQLYYKEGISSFILICASDYSRVGRGNGIVSDIDKRKNLSLEEAHTGLVHSINKMAMANGMDIKLSLFPFYYLASREYSRKEKNYISNLKRLNDTIDIIYGGRISNSDIKHYSEMTGRKLTLRHPIPVVQAGKPRSLSFNLYRMFQDIYSDVDQKYINGIILEDFKSTHELKMIANFLWNYGR